MISETIARPYAEAAFLWAKEHDALDAWRVFLKTQAELFSGEPLCSWVKNPLVDWVAQIHSVFEITSKNTTNAEEPLQRAQCNFLLLLATNKRLAYLDAIWQRYQRYYDDHANIAHVVVTTAFDLDAATEKKLTHGLEQRFQKNIVLEQKKEAALLGGLRIQMGDSLLDTSVRGMLSQLAQTMITI